MCIYACMKHLWWIMYHMCAIYIQIYCFRIPEKTLYLCQWMCLMWLLVNLYLCNLIIKYQGTQVYNHDAKEKTIHVANSTRLWLPWQQQYSTLEPRWCIKAACIMMPWWFEEQSCGTRRVTPNLHLQSAVKEWQDSVHYVASRRRPWMDWCNRAFGMFAYLVGQGSREVKKRHFWAFDSLIHGIKRMFCIWPGSDSECRRLQATCNCMCAGYM